MPEPPLPVDYRDYYRRLFRKFLQDLFKLGSDQLIGALLTIAILALQLYYGVIPATLTLQAVESVGWPYLLVIVGLSLLSVFRAPAQLDAKLQRDVGVLTMRLELPDKAQAEYLAGLLGKVGDAEKAIVRFVLLHDEIDMTHINIPGLAYVEIGEAIQTCLKVGLLRKRTETPTDRHSAVALFLSVDFYNVPLEFRETLKRLLYATPALSNSLNSQT